MSIATMILGQSGTGKSTSLRNLDPAKVLLIQSVKKPLPFRSTGWEPISKENPNGNIFVTDDAARMVNAIQKTNREIIVIDDFQYVMAIEFMHRSAEKGYEKFTEIGRHAFDVVMTSIKAADNKRVYILSHTQENENGRTSIKTIGRMLDEKITLEGLVTICLQTAVINGQYVFTTQNSGMNTVKSPMGLFDQEHIPNDLAAVDAAICDYYNIHHTQTEG